MERATWIYQLAELITIYDVYTWAIFLSCCILVSYFLSRVTVLAVDRLGSAWNVGFGLLALILDQGSPTFDKSVLRRKLAAVILEENMALVLYSNLKRPNKPTYFEKDIIHETLEGYHYYGLFPEQFILRPKYFFQTGILEWWRKYFDWAIVLKTHINANRNVKKHGSVIQNDDKVKTQILVLSFAPGIGFLLSIVAFLCLEARMEIFEFLKWKITNMKTYVKT